MKARWQTRKAASAASRFLWLAALARFAVVASSSAVAQQDQTLPPDLMANVNAGQLAAAETQARALLRIRSDFAPANFLLGYVLFREHRYTDSLAAYTEGAKTQAPSAEDLIVVASDYIQLQSYPDAVRWLNYVTEHTPGNATAWYLLGRSQFLLDHPAEALAAFQQYLQLQPGNLAAQYNSGLALERLQRTAEAEAVYRQAIALATAQHSADPQPWLDLGNLLLVNGRPAEAVPPLSMAASKAPKNATCQQQFGVALAATGDETGAVKALQRAVELAPKAKRAHYYLARSLKALGRKRESDAEFAAVDRLATTHQDEETPNPDITPSIGREKLPYND